MFEILKTKFAINVMKDIDMRPYNPASRKFLLTFSKVQNNEGCADGRRQALAFVI